MPAKAGTDASFSADDVPHLSCTGRLWQLAWVPTCVGMTVME